MRRRSTVAAIDVGSTKVAVIVGDAGARGETRLLGVGVAPAAGLTRGVIDNITSARESISIAVEKAEQACGMRILSAVVGISGAHISSQSNRAIIAVADRTRPVSSDDRERVLDAAGQIAIPTNRQVLHVLPRHYWIEGTEQVSDPVGMYGSRVDAETHIVTGQTSAIQNLTKCVEGAGVQVDEIIIEGLASAHSVLTEQEKRQGVALVDIGGALTSLVVFDEGTVAHTASLPIAGSHLTQDLTHVLRCPWESAEQLKCQHGAAHAGEVRVGETAEITAFGTHPQKTVSLELVRQILQARCEEILEMIQIELKRVGYYDRVAAGLVLTGGSSQLRGFADLAEARLGLPARIGLPAGYSGMSDVVGTPAYATSIGLVEFALQGRERPAELVSAGFEVPAGGFLRRLVSLGRALMPE